MNTSLLFALLVPCSIIAMNNNTHQTPPIGTMSLKWNTNKRPEYIVSYQKNFITIPYGLCLNNNYYHYGFPIQDKRIKRFIQLTDVIANKYLNLYKDLTPSKNQPLQNLSFNLYEQIYTCNGPQNMLTRFSHDALGLIGQLKELSTRYNHL